MSDTNEAPVKPGQTARTVALPGALTMPVVNPAPRPGRRSKNVISIWTAGRIQARRAVSVGRYRSETERKDQRQKVSELIATFIEAGEAYSRALEQISKHDHLLSALEVVTLKDRAVEFGCRTITATSELHTVKGQS